MKRHIQTIAFIVIFILVNTVTFAEPVFEKVEEVANTLKFILLGDNTLKIEAEKISLDILGLKVEKLNGKWIIKSMDTKKAVKFDNEINIKKIEKEEIFVDLIKELDKEENIISFEIKDRNQLLTIEWYGKDRINSQDLKDIDSDIKSLCL